MDYPNSEILKRDINYKSEAQSLSQIKENILSHSVFNAIDVEAQSGDDEGECEDEQEETII